MPTVSELALLLTARDEMSKVLDNVKEKSGGLGKVLGDVSKIAGGFVVGAGIQKLGGFLVDAAKGAADDAASQGRLQQAIENTGVAYGDYQGQIESVISAGQKKGFTDDQTRNSLSLLAAQTGSTEEATKRYALAQDLARGANIDVVTASKLLGKVTEDNVNVLGRYGIAAKEGMSETELFGMVQEKFGGQAEKFASTTAGKMAVLSDKMGELKETIGAAVLPVMTALASFALDVVMPALEKLANLVGPILGAAFKAIAGPVKEFIGALRTGLTEDEVPTTIESIAFKIRALAKAFGDVVAAMQPFIESFLGNKDALMAAGVGIGAVMGVAFAAWAIAAGAAAVATIAAAAPVIALGLVIAALAAGIFLLVKNWDQITEKYPIVGAATEAFKSVLLTVWGAIKDAIGAAVSFISDNIGKLTPVFQFFQDFVKAKIDGVIQVVGAIVEIVTSTVNLVSDLFHGRWSQAWGEMKDIASALIDLLVGYVRMMFGNIPEIIIGLAGDALNAAKTFGANVYLGIKGEIEDLPNALYEIGAKLVNGLWDGISSMASSIYNKVSGFASTIKDKVTDGLGELWPNSPSVAGIKIATGLADGIAVGAPKALAAASAMANDTLDVMRDALREAYAMGIDVPREAWMSVGGLDRGSLQTKMARSLLANEDRDPGSWGGSEQAKDFNEMAAALDNARRMGYTLPAGFAQGTNYVPRTGLALLHKGEAVVPASQNRGGQPIVINVNVAGSIRSDKDIAQIIRDELLRGGFYGLIPRVA